MRFRRCGSVDAAGPQFRRRSRYGDALPEYLVSAAGARDRGAMIKEDELRHLLSDAESDRVERTVAAKNTDKFSEAVTAFANDVANHQLPGYLVVGANDDGSLSGLTVTDELLRNLAGLRSDGAIQPMPALNVAKFTMPGGD